VKTAVLVSDVALSRTRVADYLALTRPRIAVMVLFTVGMGALLAGGFALNLAVLFHVVFGTTLVAAGASALNQVLERHSDALMPRTENRPLPAGRLQPIEALVFGLLLAAAGLVWLGCTLRTPLAAGVAGLTLVLYVFVYTPLKSVSTLNTLVGAVPGALPPIIGWTAVRNDLSTEAVALFAILFLWQVPHFLAIAWIYREEYARAGLQMLPIHDPDGRHTGRHMAHYCLALVAASLLPVVSGTAGVLYFAGALVLGLGFFARAVGFLREVSDARARGVMLASLVYLPALLVLMVVDVALR
jgi:protoheme IX farnesyltransferase